MADSLTSAGFWLALFQIGYLNLLLSGDNDFATLPELMSRLALSAEGALCHTMRYPETR